MALTDKIEGALASQEIRQAFFQDEWSGLNHTPEREKRIEPANYDIVTEDVCWRVPDGFKPDRGVPVLESLRRLNPRERPQHKISEQNGIVAYKDFSWLFPLEGTWKIPQNFFMRASPKSTEGRMGNLDRLVLDGIPKYDYIPPGFAGKMYVLVKPLAFNNLVFPGFPFNQLRAYCRKRWVLSDEELKMLINQRGLVKRNGVPIPVDELEFDNGLLLTADLTGENSEGVVGFRARSNPEPVDRRKERAIDWEHYFDALMAPRGGELQLKKPHLYLTQSWEWVEMTETHAGVMQYYRPDIMESRSNAAGYFDANKFKGIATLEIPNFNEDFTLHHRSPCCAIEVEQVRSTPDKQYRGKHLDQKFALVPKPMTLPDPAEIAGKVANEKELIMYVDRAKLFGSEYFEGFSSAERVDFYKRVLEHYDFGKRGSAELGTGLESDTSKKQPIAYVVFVNPQDKSVFTYIRASEKENYAETRLYGKLSIGAGGHVRVGDKREMPSEPLRASLHRECHKEEITINGTASEPKLLGYINDDNYSSVDAVHFGLLHVVEVNGTIAPNDAEIKEGRMVPITELRKMLGDKAYNVERWTQIAMPVIEKMYGGG